MSLEQVMATEGAGQVSEPFDYDPESLAAIWHKIHSIDCEPLPTADHLQQILAHQNLLQASPVYGKDYAALSDALMAAWTAFHNGCFLQAYEMGKACGPVGAYVALLALNSYAGYLAPDDEKAQLFHDAAQQAKQATSILPEAINIEYAHALNLGRYCESVSISKAITSGAAPAFKKSLDRCLALDNQHTPSLLAQGALFAQVIDAIGELGARVSFGATRKKVLTVFDLATQVAAPPPVVFLEYAKYLYLLDRKSRTKVKSLLQQALDAPVLDPLDQFDQAEAQRLLQSL